MDTIVPSGPIQRIDYADPSVLMVAFDLIEQVCRARNLGAMTDSELLDRLTEYRTYLRAMHAGRA